MKYHYEITHKDNPKDVKFYSKKYELFRHGFDEYKQARKNADIMMGVKGLSKENHVVNVFPDN